MSQFPFIGLTGGIGAGKSTALDAFARLGAAVLSTDQVVHGLYEGGDVRDAVVERFGGSVAPNGVVDRGALARVAFGDSEDRAWLEALLWPRVGEEMAGWKERVQAASPPPRAGVVEVPLLFEAGLEDAFDATVAVIAGADVSRERAASRGHESLEARTARQLSQTDKARRATYAVTNDGTVAQLEEKLSAILDMLHG
ncbi:MAG: dephospho-CoA kinase [Actinomycetota bacterium]|nr:dephospho-CoA kinase [Actinomycetota bacterium]